jgi:hypothetical protein
MTNKEGILASGFLSRESVELLKIYIPTLDKADNPYLFPSNHEGHISPEWINLLLERLSVKAGIQLNGKTLSFHCFRKMFLSSCIDSGIGLTAGKKLCGKTIPQSDDTYLTTINLREKFIQLKKILTIQSQVPQSTDKIKQLEDSIRQQQIEIGDYKTRVEVLSEDYKKVETLLILLNANLQKLGELDKIITKIPPEEIIDKAREYAIKKSESEGLSPLDSMLKDLKTNIEKAKENKEKADSVKKPSIVPQ